jgi:GTP-binding protein
VIATSSATRVGIAELAAELERRVASRAQALVGEVSAAQASAGALGAGGAGEEELAEHVVLRPAEQSGFSVRRLGPRAFAVAGPGIERLIGRFDTANEDAMAYLEERLRRIGVLRALQAQGFSDGDQLQIGGVSLELGPAAAGKRR